MLGVLIIIFFIHSIDCSRNTLYNGSEKSSNDLKNLQVGEDVEACYQGRWYPVSITARQDDIAGDDDAAARPGGGVVYTVKYFNWGNTEDFGPLDVRRLQGSVVEIKMRKECNQNEKTVLPSLEQPLRKHLFLLFY